MPKAALTALADLVDRPADDLAGLDGCRAADLKRLTELVSARIEAEERAIETGLQDALDAIPRPLRSRARALLQMEES